MVASVGEAAVARRIEREMARSLEAKRKRRDDNIREDKRARCAVVFQAIWRGRCMRALVAPALASRRREAEEIRRMFQEERLAECVVALEAERRELELKRQCTELDAMRYAEKRTRTSWAFLRHLEETARGEELVRMRAEERFTRALMDVEIQDLRRAQIAQREEEESGRMHAEDLAMRELKLAEKAQILERVLMQAEDMLARGLKNFEQQELASSRAEGYRMAAEDSASATWNAEFRRQREACLREAWARSTPIQRAVDPRGVAAARALVCADGVRTPSKPEPSELLDERTILVMEQARRREYCKSHLDRISASALRVRKDRQAAAHTKGLGRTLSVHGNKSGARGGSQGEMSFEEDLVSPKNDRAGPAERDGAECKLTSDMLSHLGPLEDLTALELCVEGLTSASLLQACTSLKSLSLNVNRLSSPSGLVVSTSLVRLGLRDNRLSSLQGLSGLPSLRELRLDINHLSSLHELKLLPALVELSANTNHIRELPEGFAAGLMQPTDPIPAQTETCPTVVERAVACGGLQKLELYHNRLASINPRALQGLASLTHLDLGRNQLQTLDGQALECCPALSTLILSQNLLREPPSPLCLPLLNELWLSGNQIRSMGSWASSPTETRLDSLPERWTKHRAILEGALLELSGDSPQQLRASPGDQHLKHIPFLGRVSEGQGRESEYGKQETSTRGEHGRTYDDATVWLPSLEVLHLQDNALETLGGRFSLAGCPLLRSFDASFNQLRAPDEIALSLEACSGLEEVRLHDNPASACPNYADAITLSCPHLTRMDGVHLDAQVHWRAGANTYGRRADLVLPFLLETGETSEARRGAAAATPTTARNETTGNDVSESKASKEASVGDYCPWCGVCTLRAKHANDTVEESDAVNVAEVIVRGRDGERDEASGLDPASGTTNLPQHIPGCVEGGRFSGPSTCVSCGFELPSANLWSVSESRAARSFVSWQDVCSAGGRWRDGFCADVRDTIGIGQEEMSERDSFRKACLQGRVEREKMRRRHRREERNVTTGAGVNEERTAQLVASSPGVRQDVGTTWPANEKAVTKLQSAFRGFHVRRALQAALDSAKYVDDELEGLLNINGGDRFELDRFLSPPPELGDGWLGTTAVAQGNKNIPRHPTPPSRAKATSIRLIDTARAAVSNTPRRPHPRGGDGVEATSRTRLDSYCTGGTGHATKSTFLSETAQAVQTGRSDDRETAERTTSDEGGASARDKASEGGGGRGRRAKSDLARDWGLTDPRAARAFAKRAKRLRKFQNGEGQKKKNTQHSRNGSGGESATQRSNGGEGGWVQVPRAPREARPRLAPVGSDDPAVATTDPGAQQSTRRGARPWPLTKPHRSSPRRGRPCAQLHAQDLGLSCAETVFVHKSGPTAV
ncbi:unnamed protein product [Ectocarpus sp. 6 AP-2014]